MRTIAEIRRTNLERLAEEAGSLDAVAERADTNAVYLTQIRTRYPDRRTGRPREMGSRLARRLEKAFGKPTGWMDTPSAPAVCEPPPRPYVAPPRPACDFCERLVTDREWQLLQDVRAMPTEDRARLFADVHDRALTIRRHVAHYLKELKDNGPRD